MKSHGDFDFQALLVMLAAVVVLLVMLLISGAFDAMPLNLGGIR